VPENLMQSQLLTGFSTFEGSFTPADTPRLDMAAFPHLDADAFAALAAPLPDIHTMDTVLPSVSWFSGRYPGFIQVKCAHSILSTCLVLSYWFQWGRVAVLQPDSANSQRKAVNSEAGRRR
jgi:hypothetical protein